VAQLPVFFRTLSGQKPSREDLDKLVELIKAPIDLERPAQIQGAIQSQRAHLAGSRPLASHAPDGLLPARESPRPRRIRSASRPRSVNGLREQLDIDALLMGD